MTQEAVDYDDIVEREDIGYMINLFKKKHDNEV